MIYENFKVSGTGESLVDFNDLQRVQLKYDNVQGFHTKWDGSTSLHDKSEEICRKCYKKQRRFCKELKPLTALDEVVDGQICMMDSKRAGSWHKEFVVKVRTRREHET